jgi:hypothetical protein
MKLDKITAYIKPVKDFIVRYAVLVFVLSMVCIFGFMTLRIAHYSNAEPTEIQIEDKKASLRVISLDENAIEKIEQLKAKNISIESLFSSGRDNPFE